MPVRIQRKRTRGFKMPAGVVYVGRGTRYGNPFPLNAGETPAQVVRRYRELLAETEAAYQRHGRRFVSTMPVYSDIREALRGKDLACWCALDKPCHADVLLEIANAEVQA